MNEENKKLENIRKSCKAARIFSKIILIAFMVATVLCLFSGIGLLVTKDKMDETLLTAAEQGDKIELEMKAGPFILGRFEDGDFVAADKMESSIPALNTYFEANADSPSLIMGFYILFMGTMFAFLTVALFFITSIFDIIVKEGNPFVDRVRKRALIAMIILSVIVATTAGLGFGVLLGFLTWVIYTILDYGCQLKLLSDETL